MRAFSSDSAGGSPADIFATHRAQPYAVLARAAAEQLPVDFSGVLAVVATVRAAAFDGRACDPWVAAPEQFCDDLAQLAGEISAARAAKVVQFTEPLRMADLLPGILTIASRYPGRPVHLVELGACAGLLLAPEAYRIDYPHGVWNPDGRAALTSDLDVPPDLLAGELLIADRLGLDLAPVDSRDPRAFDYLRTFTWAGDPTREPRLQSALAAVAHDPPPVICADVVEVLPEVLAERVTRDVLTIVLESGLSNYLPGREARQIGQTLGTVASRGPLALISRSAQPVAVAGLPTTVSVLDLSARWLRIYAAADLLSERTRWLSAS